MPARLPKRQKLSPDAKPTDDNDDYVKFAQAARARSIVINGVHAARIPGAGLGLRTIRKVKKGEQLIFVPESAMFKPDIKFLNSHALHQKVSPQAALAISALACASNSPNAFYQTWMSTWPTEQDFTASMPMCWSSTRQDQLPPTVQQHLQRQLADYTRDWEAVSSLCASQNWSETRFRYFWMIVNSRSFHWKPAPPRRSQSHTKPSRPGGGGGGGGGGGAMVMCPYLDFMNHGPSGSTISVFQRSNGYEVLADRDYPPATEIFATYGSHSNDRLLVHYGFVLADSQKTDDDIPLDHILLPTWSAALRTQLRDVGYLGNYALVRETNTLCFRTQVAVRAALLTCNEWEYFLGEAEDLGVDRSADVCEFVAKLLQPYAEFARQQQKEMESQFEAVRHEDAEIDVAESMPLQLIAARWRQTAVALEKYLSR